MHVLFASYGNDSIALMQWAHEAGLRDVYVLYSDTGWAEPGWHNRVEAAENVARGYGFTPARTQSIGMLNLVKQRKGWPRQGIQFCTTELKIEPAKRWLDENDPDKKAICYVGVRAEESEARTRFPKSVQNSENHGGRALRAPLLHVKEGERDALIRRAGFEPLPHRSEECYPCINANRADLKRVDEKRVCVIEKAEQELGFTPKGKPRTMFRPYRHMGATGIREIIRWAHSPRGKFDPDDGTGGGNCDSGFCGT